MSENPINLNSSEFKHRQINSYVSLFAANVLIHRMSRDYIDFRIKNENGGTKTIDVILFLDKVNIEVESFLSRIEMIKYVYNLSAEDISELDGIKTKIGNIKSFIEGNITEGEPFNNLILALTDFCLYISKLKITEKLDSQLEEMKGKVEKQKQKDNKFKNRDMQLTLFKRCKCKISLENPILIIQKVFKFYLRNPFTIQKKENSIEICIRKPYGVYKFENKQEDSQLIDTSEQKK